MNMSTATGRHRRDHASNRILRAALLATPAIAAAWALAPASADAASTRYWDLNGATAGATDDAGGVASGTWDEASSFNWGNSGGTGATTFFVNGDTAVFSAGTNATGASTITINSSGGAFPVSAAAVTLQEGTLTFVGDALTLTGPNLNTSTSNVTTFEALINSAVGITKLGAGSLTLKGSNAITGATTVTGGTLVLDYTVNNNDKIDAASALNMNVSGSLNVVGANGAGDTSQSVNGLVLTSGGSTNLTVTKGDTGNTTLNLGEITRGALALTNFATAGTGAGTANFTTTAVNTNGIVGAYATFNKTDWAAASGGNLVALGTHATNDFSAATNNVDVTSDQSPAADFAVNTIRFNTAAPVTLNLAGTNNSTSGILVGADVGANAVTLAGGGITAPGELIVQQHNTAGDLVVNGAFTGAAEVTKGGLGAMVLNGDNTNAGFNISGGSIRTGASERVANNAYVNITTGASFDIGANTETLDRVTGFGNLRVAGGRVNLTNAGATSFSGPTTVGAGGATLDLQSASANMNVSGAINNTAGTFTKTGPGTLTLRGNMVGNSTSTVRIEGGAVNIESSLRFGTQGKIVLDNGAILEQANPGFAGSFISGATTLEIGPNGGTVHFNTPTVGPNVSGISIYGGSNAKGFIGGTGTLTKTGIGEFRYQGVGLPLTTFSKLVVKEGLFRLGFNSSIQDERGFGAVPAVFTQDAITLDGGAIATSFLASFSVLHENRGMTLGPGGGTILSHMTIPKITGVGDLTTGSGTVVLAGQNDFTGNLIVNTVTQLNENMTIGGLAGNDDTAQTATIAADKTFAAGINNQNTTFFGQLAGDGSFNKVGTGTLELTGNEFTNAGATTISGGTIKFGVASAGLSNSSAVSITADGTLDMNAINDTVGSLEGAGPIINGANLTVAGVNAAPVTYSGNYSGTGTFTKNGTGEQNLAGTNAFAATVVSGGILGVQSNGAIAGNLTVENDAVVKYAPSGTITAKVGTVTVTGTGKIDLADNKLVTSSPVGAFVAGVYEPTSVSGLIQTGRGSAGGNAQWNGASGITTSDARAIDSSNRTSLGVIDASDKFRQPGGAPIGEADTALFGGQTVTGADTLVMFTWGGDANLDGKINIDDYGRIDSNVGTPGAHGWANGDFNYDGKINIDDYGIIDSNISNQGGVVFPTGGGAGELALAAGGVSAVPEPTGLTLVALGALALTGRRTRRKFIIGCSA